MAITKEQLNEIIEPKADLEKVTTISSDGQKLVMRIPKDIEEELEVKKGDKMRWLIKEGSKEIILKLENGS